MEKITKTCCRLKNNLDQQKGRFLLILFCKYVLIARDKLPRYGRAINNSFSQQSMRREFKKVLMQLSITLMGNTFFLKMSFK